MADIDHKTAQEWTEKTLARIDSAFFDRNLAACYLDLQAKLGAAERDLINQRNGYTGMVDAAEQRLREVEAWARDVRITIRGIDGQAQRLVGPPPLSNWKAEEIIIGYKLNTGLWHKLLGLLACCPASESALAPERTVAGQEPSYHDEVIKAREQGYYRDTVVAPTSPLLPGLERAAERTLDQIADVFGIGHRARIPSTILANVINANRRSDCLSAIEREFFTKLVDDEDEGGQIKECSLNWGSEPAEYVEQFRAEISRLKGSES